MQDTVFREYDIRGIVGQELIIDHVYDLTCAIAYYFKLHAPDMQKVVIGMDGRTHSSFIKDIVCNALQSSGVDVVFIGLCTSPILYFALHQQYADAGIMITASHNPGSYNGFKICLGTKSLWGHQIREIKEFYFQRKKVASCTYGVYSEQDAVAEYIDWLSHHFHYMRGWDYSFVVDCGNGAAGAVIPQLVERMEWKNATILYPEIDGLYPHHEADPTVYDNMRDVKKVLDTTNAMIGIGLDGDADRMGVMLKSGYLIPGDQLLGFFAQDIFKDKNGLVVCDIKTSQALLDFLELNDIKSHLAPCGHAIIKDHMKQREALLGGELSCHFMFADRYFGCDDGVYAMMRLLELLHAGGSLESYIDQYPTYYSSPEFRLPCEHAHKQEVIDNFKRNLLEKYPEATVNIIDGVRISVTDQWVLIRASNTQSVLSLRFESRTESGYKQLKEDIILGLSDSLDVSLIDKVDL